MDNRQHILPALAKAAVLIAAASAVIAQAWIGGQEWPRLPVLTFAAFMAGLLLVRFLPTAGWAPLVGVAYVYPAIFHATRGAFVPAYHAIWFGGLLGAIAGGGNFLRWHLPSPWRLPLVFWALVVGLGWPIIAMREMNFSWASSWQYSLANSGLGGPPPVVIASMLVVVLTQLLGILWFDAMFAAFWERDPARFRRSIILPLLSSVLIGAALAVYQWQVDINFLSAHQWPHYRRAAGGLLDGNAFGALQGIWSGATLALALSSAPLSFTAGLGAVLLLWFGIWATGSRMALLSGLIGLAFVLFAAPRKGLARFRSPRLAVLVVALLVSAVVIGVAGRFRMDPIARTFKSLPEPTRASVTRFVEFEFWNRFGPFGTASLQMIKDSPIVGVGTGTFEVLFPDYAYALTDGKTRAHFDNAQSWYRHRLAELGFLGSLGWITWVGVFGLFVWRAAPARDGVSEATGARAALIALAVISIVSMPSRNAFVALTFWVFAFWLVQSAGGPSEDGRLARLSARRAPWAAVWILALAFAGGTAWVAHADLRPPYRALMADWDYVNGISRVIRTPEGRRRHAGAHGVAVFAAKPGYLRLVFQLPHEDAARDPVRVRIFERNTLQANLLVSDRVEHTIYVRVPEGDDRLMIQTRVSRVVPASEVVPARGLILHNWTFVQEPPRGAMIGGEVSVFPPPRNP